MQSIVSNIVNCSLCPLRGGCTAPVPPKVVANPSVFIVGEAPGQVEDNKGEPFVGPTGTETRHYLHWVAGIQWERCYVSNAVKCRPPENETPEPWIVDLCTALYLHEEIKAVKPKYIAAMGAVATRALLGPGYSMEFHHGIPYFLPDTDIIVLPMYHPAAGLHNTAIMTRCIQDFEALLQVVQGKLKPRAERDAFPDVCYRRIENPGMLEAALHTNKRNRVAVDTETVEIPYKVPYNKPLCLTFSKTPGNGWLIDAYRTDLLARFNDYVNRREVTTILHNAMFDLPVMKDLGVVPYRYEDSMVGAYLLQDQPQGLKTLAYRLCGMKMNGYGQVVGKNGWDRIMELMETIKGVPWVDPDPVLVPRPVEDQIKTGNKYKVYTAQGVNRRVRDLCRKWAREPRRFNPYERWMNIAFDHRKQVYDVFGYFPGPNLSDVADPDYVHYACRDADATLRIWPIVEEKMCDMNLLDVYRLDMDTLPMLLDMMAHGMLVDEDRIVNLSHYYEYSMDTVFETIKKMVHRPVNPNSHPQVRALLFQHLRIREPRGKKSKTAKTGEISTGAKVLENLRNEHAVVPLILQYRGLSKNKGSFADKMQHYIDDGGRVHPHIRCTRTATGRLSCDNPNLQNIPTRNEEGTKIRRCFMAPDGCVYVARDYSQLELRVMAHESRDPRMLDIFRNGEDIHDMTASALFGIPADRLDKNKHRRPTKTVNFGIPYGMSVEGLFDTLRAMHIQWTMAQCEDFHNEWFRLYGGVKTMFQEVYRYARQKGYVRTLGGRIRRIPEVRSALGYIVSQGERYAGNMVIQGGAQDVMKMAMRDMTPQYQLFQMEGHTCHPLIQIHDDCVYEVSIDCLDRFLEVNRCVMENCVELNVPLIADVKVGTNWGDMTELDDRDEETALWNYLAEYYQDEEKREEVSV